MLSEFFLGDFLLCAQKQQKSSPPNATCGCQNVKKGSRELILLYGEHLLKDEKFETTDEV